jgi:hypothetical protein
MHTNLVEYECGQRKMVACGAEETPDTESMFNIITVMWHIITVMSQCMLQENSVSVKHAWHTRVFHCIGGTHWQGKWHAVLRGCGC